MGRAEKRFWDFLIKQRLKVFIACATILSMYARFRLRNMVSPDMELFLIPWYDEIRELGGLKALSAQVGNYQISYQTLIALMTYLPLNKIYAYKLISVIFDYGMGIAAAAIVRDLTGNKEKATITYAIIIFLPISILNSAAWGQCDSIYTFFLLTTFLYLLRDKYNAAMICYGLAFAFKLQAVFFLPFLLFYYIWSKKFSALRFLLVPVPVLVFSLGGLVQGRSLLDIVSIYTKQGGLYRQISMNYPSFWNLISETSARNDMNYYTELQIMCLGTAVIILGGIMLWLIKKKQLGGNAFMMISTLMMYTCVLFLPAMHERYNFPVLIFAIVACILYPRAFPTALGMLIIDMQTYSQYLLNKDIFSFDFLVLLNIISYVLLATMTRQMVLNVQERKGCNVRTAE